MANTNAPFGLRPYTGPIGGAGVNFGYVYREIAYDDTTKIFTGDPVKQLNTGYVGQWTAGTAVSQMIGIFVGCKYLSTAFGRVVESPYWPGADVASGNKVLAKLIPCNLAAPSSWLIQTDATGITIADVGINADIALGTGNTYTGVSAAYLNATSTLNTTATLPFRITGLYSDVAPPNVQGAQSGAYNWAIVTANVGGAGSTGI